MSKHSDLAKELFKKGYNCAQAVFVAFGDETGLELENALKISSSFGSGMGRLREVCGAVSGMFMVAGMKYGYTDPLDRVSKAEHYKMIKHLANEFREENNSIVCRELLGLCENKDSSNVQGRTKANHKKRPCIELVEHAAVILDEYIDDKRMEETK